MRRPALIIERKFSAAAALLLALCSPLMSSCATPVERTDRIASGLALHKSTVRGTSFNHVIYRSAAGAPRAVLHVYIEGDGSPFKDHTTVAADPTSREPLMLRLMGEDPAPSVYLGRPCYLGPNTDPACTPDEWTFRRFAPEILDSMESALRAEIARSGASSVALFGHSGGATLAVLLAQRVEAVTRVVTIGPTLDIDAWCSLHRYSALTGSVNPVSERPRAGVEVIHFVGERDTNTPPSLVQAAARARGGESVRIMAGFDHNCCWKGVWKHILDGVPAP